MVQEWTSFRHPSSSSRSTLRLLRNICFRSEGRVGVASPIRLIATPRVGHGGSRLLCIMLEIFLEKNLFLCMSLPQVYITFDHLRCMLLHFLLIAHDCTLIPLHSGIVYGGTSRGLECRCRVSCKRPKRQMYSLLPETLGIPNPQIIPSDASC